MFVILFAAVNLIQVFAAPTISNNPANPRLIIAVVRGRTAATSWRPTATVLARSIDDRPNGSVPAAVPAGRRCTRTSPGYFSLKCGIDRLESSYNDYLGAKSNDLLGSTLLDLILNRPKRGASVVTTIDPELQQVAFDELSKVAPHGGAVVALNPSHRRGPGHGRRSRSYDPNAAHPAEPRRRGRGLQAAQRDPDDPLLSNATDQLYPPGSTFKLVDLSAALENGMTLQTRFPNPPSSTSPRPTSRCRTSAGSTAPAARRPSRWSRRSSSRAT